MVASATKAPIGREYNMELKICSRFQQYKMYAAIAQGIERRVNKINREKRKPPENWGINIPKIACNP